MIKYILIFCLLFQAQSQYKVILDEEFNDNSKEWTLGGDETYNIDIINGTYTFERMQANGSGRFFWNYFEELGDNNWVIEAKLKHISGVDNYGYGINFMTSDVNNSNFFMITKNGFYCLAKYSKGTYSDLVKWTSKPEIIKPDENILQIRRYHNYLNFYINGKYLFKEYFDNVQYFGYNVGFCIYDKQKIAADYLKIMIDTSKVKTVENPINGNKKINLGSAVNSKYREIYPIISADEKTLYFTRIDDPANVGDDTDYDIYYATKNEKGEWSETHHFSPPINNISANSVVSAMPDNNNLILSGNYNPDSQTTTGGISIISKTKDGWSYPRNIKIENYYNYNRYVEYFMSADRSFILMTVERDDSFGERDIYVSFRLDSNNYSEPKNLGNKVCTFAEENSPYMAPDNTTLYFSSHGHTTYGNADIFVTRRLDDTWLNWTEPLNLGPEINSADWDAYFSISASGEQAYVVSSDEVNGLDIYSIKLPASARPNPVVLVKGKVYNSETKEVIGTEIKFNKLTGEKSKAFAESDPKTGEYQIVLNGGTNYEYFAEKSGFYPKSETLDLNTLVAYKEITQDLYLSPIKKGQKIRLNNLFFATNKSELRDESKNELDRLIDMLNQNPIMEISISGHTDNQGDQVLNQKLSKDRAKSVYDYLVTKGIVSARLRFEGFASKKPVAENTTSEGRALNRRVEIEIVKE